jgi:hypothetical protein
MKNDKNKYKCYRERETVKNWEMESEKIAKAKKGMREKMELHIMYTV